MPYIIRAGIIISDFSSPEFQFLSLIKWNFWRLSGYELARNEIFLRHKSRGTGAGLVEV